MLGLRAEISHGPEAASDETRQIARLGLSLAATGVVENYPGGELSPLGDLPEEVFEMRRIMVSFLFAVSTSTLLWAQEIKRGCPDRC